METSRPTGLTSEHIAIIVVSVLLFLVPVLVIPFGGFPVTFSRTILAMAAVAILMIVLTIRTLTQGHLELPRSPLVLALLLLPVGYLISAIFSTHPTLSFFGSQLDQDTFGFIALVSSLALLIALLVPKHKVFTPLMALLFAGWAVLVFQVVQLVFQTPLPVAIFANPTANLVGTWTEFGILIGLIVSLLIVVLGSLTLSRMYRVIVIVTIVLGLLFLMLIAFVPVWAVLALVSFTSLVYSIATRFVLKGSDSERLSPVVIALVLAVALFFLFFGAGVTTRLQTLVGIQSLSVRPSLEGTLMVLNGVYAERPLVGTGPNTFSSGWLLYRPQPVLLSPFWNTHFTSGSGTIPTAIATGGAVVGVVWLMVLFALAYTLLRALITLPSSGDRRYIITALISLGTAYLALMHVLYAPGSWATILFFMMLGLLIATLKDTPLIRLHSISLRASPRVGFVTVMGVLLLSGTSVLSLYGVARLYLGTVNYNQAVAAADSGDLDRAEEVLARARTFANEDHYDRAAAAINLARLTALVYSGASDEATQSQFRDVLVKAVENSRAAVDRDPAKYENWLARADVFATVVPLKIEGAYENALAALDRARALSPQSPEIDLRVAQIKVGNGDIPGAREAIKGALDKKADYTDAIVFLAQIELGEGNLAEAIDSVKAAVYFEPSNPTLLYQLGVLLISDQRHQDAATAFEAALQSNPAYEDAMFFLAEAYAFLGRTEDAARLMGELVNRNPNNMLVGAYHDALSRGSNPFSASTPPPDTPSPTP